jgi:hypothetical protein
MLGTIAAPSLTKPAVMVVEIAAPTSGAAVVAAVSAAVASAPVAAARTVTLAPAGVRMPSVVIAAVAATAANTATVAMAAAMTAGSTAADTGPLRREAARSSGALLCLPATADMLRCAVRVRVSARPSGGSTATLSAAV